MTVTIDKFGRILIPKALRDRLGLAPGTALALGVRDGKGGAPAYSDGSRPPITSEVGHFWGA